MKSVIGSDGNSYEIKDKEIYLLKFSSVGLGLVIILVIAILLLFVYDGIKDFFRNISAVGDVYKGNYTSALLKSEGLTKDNIKRGIALVVLIIATVVVAYFSYRKTRIAFNDAPLNVQDEFNKMYPQHMQSSHNSTIG